MQIQFTGRKGVKRLHNERKLREKSSTFFSSKRSFSLPSSSEAEQQFLKKTTGGRHASLSPLTGVPPTLVSPLLHTGGHGQQTSLRYF